MVGAVVLPGLLLLLLAATIYGCFFIVRRGPDVRTEASPDADDTLHRRFLNSPGELVLLVVGACVAFYAFVVVWSRLKGH